MAKLITSSPVNSYLISYILALFAVSPNTKLGMGLRKAFYLFNLFAFGTLALTVDNRKLLKVLLKMGTVIKNGKVFDSVIKSIAVFMMYDLLRERFKLATQKLFYNISMLRNLIMFNVDKSITTTNTTGTIRSSYQFGLSVSSPESIMISTVSPFAPHRTMSILRAFFNRAFSKHIISVPERSYFGSL
ncbi:MAG: hypothetical protein A2Z42_04215 [Candidatus Woykebacteria bacterium RBG_19FT_COMBO_43_10]|uniref:Uncharacterized protein n=1 Tax=Candidatus Woykebacteria bacterium RBG_19FT_COMBO_43_10 TaxID=1802598 RepID=A0A1G1WK00_9BACT|nr:MAG: hypothetical protein A2Z42_04215 [Candidatus Woykebacteria bacterium RBG_19FT_COMBO_43_10]